MKGLGLLLLDQNNMWIIIQKSKIKQIQPSKISGYTLIKCIDENFIIKPSQRSSAGRALSALRKRSIRFDSGRCDQTTIVY